LNVDLTIRSTKTEDQYSHWTLAVPIYKMSHLTTETFDSNAREALADVQLRGALRNATSLFGTRRLAAANGLPNWQDLRTEARAIKDEVLLNLEDFIAPMLSKKGLTYQFEPCGTDATARADPDKVRQIMVNLLSNAAKFTDEGRVDVRCLVSDEAVDMQVSDTGRGVAPEMLETIFEPFVQEEGDLTRTVQGTGLGLAISRQLARAMGGDVTIRSVLGKGSTFTLRLPRSRARST
jgi:signal transduction histidine kinase